MLSWHSASAHAREERTHGIVVTAVINQRPKINEPWPRGKEANNSSKYVIEVSTSLFAACCLLLFAAVHDFWEENISSTPHVNIGKKFVYSVQRLRTKETDTQHRESTRG